MTINATNSTQQITCLTPERKDLCSSSPQRQPLKEKNQTSRRKLFDPEDRVSSLASSLLSTSSLFEQQLKVEEEKIKQNPSTKTQNTGVKPLSTSSLFELELKVEEGEIELDLFARAEETEFKDCIIELQKKIDERSFPIKFELNKEELEIIEMEKIGAGNFGSAYLVRLKKNKSELPDELVLKVPDVSSRKKTHHSLCAIKAEEQGYLRLREICAAEKENFVVIDFYDMTRERCTLPRGCHISQFIPHPFPLDSENIELIKKAQRMFAYCNNQVGNDEGIIPDLRADNIKVDDKGNLFIVDPIHPDPILEEGEGNTFRHILSGTLESYRTLAPKLDPRSKV